MTEKNKSRHFQKYFFIGLGITIFNYALYMLLANVLINDNNLIWLSSLISTLVTTIVAYYSHSKITWKDRHPGKTGIIKFFIWNFIIALIISPLFTQLFSLLTPLYNFAFSISQSLNLPFSYEFVLSTGAFTLNGILIMLLNFFFYDKLVFDKEKEESKNEE